MSELLAQQPMPRKAKAKLNRLLSGKDISPEGVDWLVEATDPFHDSPNASVGMPVGFGTRTVKKWIRKQISITKPSSVVTAGWECAIHMTPLTMLSQTAGAPVDNFLSPGSYDGVTQPTAIAGRPARIYPGVSVNTLETNGNLHSSTVATPNGGLSLTLTDWEAVGVRATPGHVVAMAFEVSNVSPELTKQGSVSYWRNPAVGCDFRAVREGAVTGMPAKLYQGMPFDATQLVNNPDTPTVEAKEGAYVVALRSEPQQARPRYPTTCTTIFKERASTDWAFIKGSSASTMVDTFLEDWAFGGAWFTGLGDDSKLTITAKYCLEIVVSPVDSLFSYATPAASYDPLAMEIYSRCMNDMPQGVPVSENPLGEWFNSLMDTVSEYAPKVLGSVPIIGGALGTGVSLAAKAAGGVNRSLQATKAEKKATKAKTATPAAKKNN